MMCLSIGSVPLVNGMGTWQPVKSYQGSAIVTYKDAVTGRVVSQTIGLVK